jgi:hypothetical protein
MNKTRASTPTETCSTAVTTLTDEEVCIIRRLRLMRTSARKMIFDLTEEYARDFPDPEKFAGTT